jgi:hypothetical protein
MHSRVSHQQTADRERDAHRYGPACVTLHKSRAGMHSRVSHQQTADRERDAHRYGPACV